eukprot:gene19116-21033_t
MIKLFSFIKPIFITVSPDYNHVARFFASYLRIKPLFIRVSFRPINSRYFSANHSKHYSRGDTAINLGSNNKVTIKDIELKNTESIAKIIHDLKNFNNNSNNNGEIERSDEFYESVKAARELRKEFLRLAKIEKSRTTMIDNLNALLYCYHNCNLPEEFDETYSMMQVDEVLNEATVSILVRQKLRSQGWKSGLRVIEDMRKKGVQPHCRTYHAVILKAIELNDFNEALDIFKEMKSLEIVFSDEFYGNLINLLIEKKSLNEEFLFEILGLLKDTGFVLGKKSFDQSKQWFTKYDFLYPPILSGFTSGICRNCGSKLKQLKLPDSTKTNLQTNLFNVAEKAITSVEGSPTTGSIKDFLNISTNSKKNKILALKQLIKSSGPFDVVLDTLNIAYLRNKGFNSFQVKRVAQHFLAKNQKVLVMCSSPLLSSLLPSRVHAPSQQHMADLLHFLRRNKCGIFFVDDEKRAGHIDDYFLLLSIVFHNMNINIVTADNFFDHVHDFDPIAKRHFARWKKSHRIALQRFSKQGQPVFTPVANYDTDVQSTSNSWHIPASDRKWLCCTKG